MNESNSQRVKIRNDSALINLRVHKPKRVPVTTIHVSYDIRVVYYRLCVARGREDKRVGLHLYWFLFLLYIQTENYEETGKSNSSFGGGT